MDGLNEYQQKAAEFKGKHLLVLAGAGTGKTRTIIARAEYLLKIGIQPNKIAVLSFTRKSAREIVERLKFSMNVDINKKTVSGKTFHSWCIEIMHFYPNYFPHHKYMLLDEDDRLSAIALAVGKNFKDSKNEKLSKDIVASIYSYSINTLCSLSEAIYHVRYCNSDKENEVVANDIELDKKIIAPVIKKYIDYKRERKYMDYDDMLSIVANILEKNKEARKAVASRYEHILVDEMQDTNPLQYKLLKSFVEDSHLFCVGDDAQSIYAFRGADFKTIHSFTDIFPQSETCKLLLNYRSTQEILDISNWVLEQSPLNYDKKLVAERGKGEKPNLIHVDDDWEEADVITDKIKESFANGGKYSDSMVLGRSNWSLAKVEAACLKKKIPYVKYGGITLMQTAHVRDVASVMRIVANNYDELAWIRFLQLWDGIGEVKAAKIISQVIVLDSFAKILENLQLLNLNSCIVETLQNVGKFVNRPAAAMTEAVRSMTVLFERKYKDDWKYRIVDFEVLQEVAKSTGSITEFITEYVLDPKAETTFKIGVADSDDVAILSTIHSAKGLEAESVHIVGVNPFVYPSSKSIKQGSDSIEEERRCLYVALTRAKNQLNIYRNIHSLHTQYDACENSDSLYFLNKLPLDLVNIVVNGEIETDYSEIECQSSIEADFPDFNFD